MKFSIQNHTWVEAYLALEIVQTHPTSGSSATVGHVRAIPAWTQQPQRREDPHCPQEMCLTTLVAQNNFLPKVKKKFFVFQSVPLLPVLSLLREVWSLYTLMSGICAHVKSVLEPALLQTDQPQLSLPTTMNIWDGNRQLLFLSYGQIQEFSLFPESENCQYFKELFSCLGIIFLRFLFYTLILYRMPSHIYYI